VEKKKSKEEEEDREGEEEKKKETKLFVGAVGREHSRATSQPPSFRDPNSPPCWPSFRAPSGSSSKTRRVLPLERIKKKERRSQGSENGTRRAGLSFQGLFLCCSLFARMPTSDEQKKKTLQTHQLRRRHPGDLVRRLDRLGGVRGQGLCVDARWLIVGRGEERGEGVSNNNKKRRHQADWRRRSLSLSLSLSLSRVGWLSLPMKRL
jgi:hypothetical protein